MIVCSCNVVSSREIEAAVEELVASDPDVVLTPGMIYRAIGVRPKCGTCLSHVVELMHAHREMLEETGENPAPMDKTPETV
jgi:bacterioferritin-associated ferredoxin